MIKYRKPLKYALTRAYTIKLKHPALARAGAVKKRNTEVITFFNYVLTIQKTFEWDGASGPVIDTVHVMRASLVHDALYAVLETLPYNKKHLKKADNIFKNLCIKDGMNSVQANAYYAGLQVYNKFRSLFNTHKNKY